MFHRHVLEGFKPPAGEPECPPMLWPCEMNFTQLTTGSFGHGRRNFWQYLAEVIILQKFLALGTLHTRPEDADLFVVPAFLAGASYVSQYVAGRARYKAKGGQFSFQDLISQLPYYNDKTKARHLFLRTSDCHWPQWSEGPPKRGVPCDWMTIDFKASESLFVTFGSMNSSDSDHHRHIVVPPLIIEKEHQPANWVNDDALAKRKYLLFLQCSPGRGIHQDRARLVDAIKPYAATNPSILLITMDSVVRIPTLAPQQTAEAMRLSTFCPVPPGDLPYTTRYFNAILSGCIPVVIRYRGGGWWQHKGPPVADSFPWSSIMKHEELAFEVLSDDIELVVPLLLSMPESEIVRKRLKVFEARQRLVYDFGGSVPDAFSTLLYFLEGHIGRRRESGGWAVSFPSQRAAETGVELKPCNLDTWQRFLRKRYFHSCCAEFPRHPQVMRCFDGGATWFQSCCVLHKDSKLDSLLPQQGTDEFVVRTSRRSIKVKQVEGQGTLGPLTESPRLLLQPGEVALARLIDMTCSRLPSDSIGVDSSECKLHRSIIQSGLCLSSTSSTALLLGAGTGVLALTLALHGASAVLVADIDRTALSLARYNVIANLDEPSSRRITYSWLNRTQHRLPTTGRPIRLVFSNQPTLLLSLLPHLQLEAGGDVQVGLTALTKTLPALRRDIATTGFAIVSEDDAHACGALSSASLFRSSWRLLTLQRRSDATP
eukprot:TRINITY_DN40782_c0_g1_i3.p1 TRINITY_DN40782_c0_g1~~TRINITY_DN40782_c0_g1_i3.p1  ORF type:complete len:712 (+),score=72.54 TRINITY_DN40782_c0_g1_i3:646-2781(+)